MIAGWFYLLCVVLASTVLWPIGRWSLKHDGHPGVMGFWISLVMGCFGLLASFLAAEPRAPRGVWIAGLLMGVAYSVGFCLLIMQCLKIGPAGPTVTINNMAMVCGVLYGTLCLRRAAIPGPLVLLGAAGTCVALVLIGIGQRTQGARQPIPRRWFPMVLAGGAFSGLSFITQTYIGELHREHRFMYLAIGAITSAAILLPLLILRPSRWKHRREAIGGAIIGGLSVVGISLSLLSFRSFSAAVVLPFTVTTPVLLMLLIGHFIYQERLTRAQLAGTITGAVSVMLLASGSA